MLIWCRINFSSRGTNPKALLELDCGKFSASTQAYTLTSYALITICPQVFTHVRLELQTAKMTDYSTSANFTDFLATSFTFILSIASISSVMLYEVLHFMFRSTSEYVS
jgi:hypothetical protein